MRYPNLDDSGDLTLSEAHVASVWPLAHGQHVNLHDDACPYYDGDECEGCGTIDIVGPTRFA